MTPAESKELRAGMTSLLMQATAVKLHCLIITIDTEDLSKFSVGGNVADAAMVEIARYYVHAMDSGAGKLKNVERIRMQTDLEQ